ncbi:MAG: hypothetical protein K6F96_06455 [Bacteroidales bacterium]|nr:hypothetical protein [Bacteroidales bacterium]
MKRTIISLFSAFAIVLMLNACSTDVDLYAEYKDITVVYGLLDSGADTNYVKINKAFLGPGNALTIAQVADSSNYPGKLNAKLIEYRATLGSNNYQKTNELPLDTITIHDKEPGIFYAPDQKVYFTTQPIRKNNEQYKYRYELQVEKGDSIISAITDIVGGKSFVLPQSAMNFGSTASNGVVNWTPCPYASVYEVVFKFHFIETTSPVDSVERIMTWALGSHPESTLHQENGTFSINFNPSMFFYNLALFLGNDTLNTNVERLIYEPSLEVCLAAGGDELYNFITVNGPSNSIVQTLPEYTNVKGGYGVLSSRLMLRKRMRLAGNTIPELTNHDYWNFKQIK